MRVDMGMPIDLRARLPDLLPRATAWAGTSSREAGASGRSLEKKEIAVARAVGVRVPELIRVATVETLPLPEDPELRAAAIQTGLLGPHMAGLTLGYSILVCRGHETFRLLSHEFRHVSQYERFGSIAAFLPEYLKQIIEFGYENAPFEVEARAFEQSGS
jgi:hypothetical protein